MVRAWPVGEIASLRLGLASTLPFVPGFLALGLAYGLTTRQTGLSAAHTLLMLLTVFAGAAQFGALQVWKSQGASTIIAVALVVNLRYLLMSASLGP